MQKNLLFLLFSKVHQICSNHGAEISATNLFKVSLQGILGKGLRIYLGFQKDKKKNIRGFSV